MDRIIKIKVHFSVSLNYQGKKDRALEDEIHYTVLSFRDRIMEEYF